MNMEDFKIKISSTEYAAVEIRPVEDGVEIVIKRKSQKNAKTEEELTGNRAILKDFCSEKKEELHWDKTMMKELVKFFNYYDKLMDEWKGKVAPEKLWKQWQTTMGKK